MRDFAEGLLPTMGLELVDVQFRREGHGWVLRLFIDREEGVTVDHCADVSREIGQFLDVEDLIGHPYHLEVSSPGLERPLKSMRDFQRFVGKKAKIRMHENLDGQKVFVGIIGEATEEAIQLDLEEGGKVRVAFDQIGRARLVF
ncbi:ribosome maturation factor RimP [Desulfobulbus sp. Tol-SR]|nr:ribosome maturation factor RimP [Desulfobulbus sp. Tol-SR]